MPTKTDRILSYLPGTFRALPRPTALYSVVNAFGDELLRSENSLAALMLAHWVDKADLNADLIQDLACIASLYGLVPRGVSAGAPFASPLVGCPPLPSDENVEHFRAHLKRYVSILLDGTVTVPGILRVVAESLGLEVAGDPAQLQSWWKARTDTLASIRGRGDDAALTIFGSGALTVVGHAAQPGQVRGSVDLVAGVDVRGASTLRLAVDAGPPVEVDLAAHAADPASVQAAEIINAVNGAGGAVASLDGGFLSIATPGAGSASRLELPDGPADAVPTVLGIAPRIYRGVDRSPAHLAGTTDISAGADLHEDRYLRLIIDEKTIEVDCAGTSPSATKLSEILTNLNHAFGVNVATAEGGHLAITSPTAGVSSRIELGRAAAQDARDLLFGQAAASVRGLDPGPGVAVGVRDLAAGVDLSQRSKVGIHFESGPSVTVDCAGSDPAHTTLSEIVAAFNRALHGPFASHDGHHIRLESPARGAAARLGFDTLPADQDATESIFGIGPRTFAGSAATSARVVGTADLSGGADLAALTSVRVALDGGPAVTVNLVEGAANLRAVTLNELIGAMKDLGAVVASHDGRHLILTSAIEGRGSRIEIQPILVRQCRRFITQAYLLDEAASVVLGVFRSSATGAAASVASVLGRVDLSRGVDLRQGRFLRMGIDGAAPRDVDCAAGVARPRAALPSEVAAAINAGLGAPVASVEGGHLRLSSLRLGAAGQIRFEPPKAADPADALALLGLNAGVYRGLPPSVVRFVGTVDLSPGIDLSAGDQVMIGLDGAPARLIHCAPGTAAHTTLNEIVMAFNAVLPSKTASHDGKHVILTSQKAGTESRIDFLPPPAGDATAAIFGITAPRHYHGSAATVAQAVGSAPLPATADLQSVHLLRVGVSLGPDADLDLATHVANPAAVTPQQVADAITHAAADRHLPLEAALTGGRLLVRLGGDGLGILRLGHVTAADARRVLLGAVPDVSTGADATPARIVGSVDLTRPIDLTGRAVLRVAVDRGMPIDIDLAGAVPEKTSLTEVVNRINDRIPGIASASTDQHLQLRSPTSGEQSSLEVLPTRTLELVEYPPRPHTEVPVSVQHGGTWQIENDGVADSQLAVVLRAPHGAIGPELVNVTDGLRIRLLLTVSPGEVAQMRPSSGGGIRAEIITADGSSRSIPGSQILAGSLGVQAWLSDGDARLSGGDATKPAQVQLNNPRADRLAVLRAYHLGQQGNRILVRVTEAALAPTAPPAIVDGGHIRLVGRLARDGTGFVLRGAAGADLARLRLGPGVAAGDLVSSVVRVLGTSFLQPGAFPLVLVDALHDIYDVTVSDPTMPGGPIVEQYPGVTIGAGEQVPDSLTVQLTIKRSRWLRGSEPGKGDALTLGRGRSEWMYLECSGARFDLTDFDRARFVGESCYDPGVFDVSRYMPTQPEHEITVFAPGAPAAPSVEIRTGWVRHEPGAFAVNLPANLPASFGGRFNLGRFARSGQAPEQYRGVVTEPASDPHHITKAVAGKSTLISADLFPGSQPPLGWAALAIPLRGRQTLTGGTRDLPAQLYLREEEGTALIRISARAAGVWGNDIGITVRKAGPARFNLMVDYEGARFENARLVVLGQSTTSLVDELLQPGPLTILRAKAAGIKAQVTRDRSDRVRDESA